MQKNQKFASRFSKQTAVSLISTLGNAQEVVEYADYFLSGIDDNKHITKDKKKSVREKIEAIKKEARSLALQEA